MAVQPAGSEEITEGSCDQKHQPQEGKEEAVMKMTAATNIKKETYDKVVR